LKFDARRDIEFPNLPAPFSGVVILVLVILLLANTSSGKSTGFKMDSVSGEQALISLPKSDEFESEKNLAQGRFLVASRKLNDPNFYQTVILLIRYNRDGASGLVINRPLNVKLSTVMPEIKELEQRKENLYLGGPVETGRILLLLKSAVEPEKSIPVFGDVYISSSRKELKRLVKSNNTGEKFRIYAGYAGWAPGQLDSERDRGDWHVLNADAATLFDKKSSEIWQELIHRFSANWVYLNTDDDSVSERFQSQKVEGVISISTADTETVKR